MFRVDVDVKIAEFGPIIRDTVNLLAHKIQERSRQDVAANLRHPGRFVKGLTTQVRRVRGGYVVQVLQRPGFAKVFEYGGTSAGKPLLWIPVPGNRIKVSKYLGKLFRPRGSRVLMRPSTRKVRSVAGTGGGPQVRYVGVASITNRPRFHLRKIALEEANNFLQHMGPGVRKR